MRFRFVAVLFFACDNGWVLADNRLLWTSSAGLQWTEITPGDSQAVHGVFFADTAHGWVLRSTVGALEIARSSDGGKTWENAAFPLSAEDRRRSAVLLQSISSMRRTDGRCCARRPA